MVENADIELCGGIVGVGLLGGQVGVLGILQALDIIAAHLLWRNVQQLGGGLQTHHPLGGVQQVVNQLPARDRRVAGYGLQGAQANLWVVCTQRNEQRLSNFRPWPGLQHAGRGGAGDGGLRLVRQQLE